MSHDWHLVELVADRLWLVENGTVTPFDGDLDAYRRRLDEREAVEDEQRRRGQPSATRKRLARREAAQARLALEPLRRKSRRGRRRQRALAAEQRALDRELAAPERFGGAGAALTDALKRRADLARRIAEAEAQWLAAEEAIERAARG